jgi:hypothetical protein
MEANGSTWDQATVLSPLGMIDRSLPCVNITEIGRFLTGQRRAANSFTAHDGTPCLTKSTEEGQCKT